MRKENVVNKNKCFPGRLLSGVSRLYSRLVNQETTLLYQQRISGRSRIKYGTTTFFNNGGFTLIELLVVVLIIGVLAAVAFPQYQKAVMKSRYMELVSVTNQLATAAESYYLANGYYPNDASVLDIEFACSYPNDFKRRFHCADFFCGIDPDQGIARCINDTAIQNGYQVTLNAGTFQRSASPDRYCFAMTTDANDKYNALCQTITKTKSAFTYGPRNRQGENQNSLWYKYSE